MPLTKSIGPECLGFLQDTASDSQPKVQGTWNLQACFGAERLLDLFIACSSVSGECGHTY